MVEEFQRDKGDAKLKQTLKNTHTKLVIIRIISCYMSLASTPIGTKFISSSVVEIASNGFKTHAFARLKKK